MGPPPVRTACDSLVALGVATADGATLFAKNSDRPAAECQPLVQIAPARHAAGTRVRCQYVDLPQVAETAGIIGSRPYWLWGLEHGVNEHGVAVGNHTVFTKDALAGEGLIGMDLVRLALERARSAEQAVEVISTLVEAHGQGGSGYADKDWPYHNSFLIADRSTASLLETSDRRWALRHITAVGSASNHLSIGADWDALADGAIEHAIARGWWDEACDDRFDFAAAFRDTSVAPDVISSGRHRRTCAVLAASHGRVTSTDLRAALRDHAGSPVHVRGYTPDDERYFTVCMHAEPVGTTTASMIARLPSDPDELLVYWGSLGSPCVGVFLPYYLEAQLPPLLARGGAEPSDASPWWRFKTLLTLVERDWPRHAEPVRAYWADFEAMVTADAADVEAKAIRLRRGGYRDGASRLLTRFMEGNVAFALGRLERLIGEMRGIG